MLKNYPITEGYSEHKIPEKELFEPEHVKAAIKKGLVYLESNCKQSGFQPDSLGMSRSNLNLDEPWLEEYWTSVMALDLLGDVFSTKTKSALIEYVYPKCGPHTVNHFKYAKIVPDYPDDVENTCLVLWYLLKNKEMNFDSHVLNVARVIFLNTEKEHGIIQTYIPPCPSFRKNRVDLASLCIVMRFLYFIGLENEATATVDHIFESLQSKTYRTGFPYYPSPETFLHFCSRAVIESPGALSKFQEPLFQEIKSRLAICPNRQPTLGDESFGPVDIAQLLLALGDLKKMNEPEVRRDIYKAVNYLLKLQNVEDGSFPKDAVFKMPRAKKFVGGQVCCTIFCVGALQAFNRQFLYE